MRSFSHPNCNAAEGLDSKKLSYQLHFAFSWEFSVSSDEFTGFFVTPRDTFFYAPSCADVADTARCSSKCVARIKMRGVQRDGSLCFPKSSNKEIVDPMFGL
jgi:hypothetical protein